MFHSFRASSFLSWRENPSFSVSERINLERSLINRVLLALRGSTTPTSDSDKQNKTKDDMNHDRGDSHGLQLGNHPLLLYTTTRAKQMHAPTASKKRERSLDNTYHRQGRTTGHPQTKTNDPNHINPHKPRFGTKVCFQHLVRITRENERTSRSLRPSLTTLRKQGNEQAQKNCPTTRNTDALPYTPSRGTILAGQGRVGQGRVGTVGKINVIDLSAVSEPRDHFCTEEAESTHRPRARLA